MPLQSLSCYSCSGREVRRAGLIGLEPKVLRRKYLSNVKHSPTIISDLIFCMRSCCGGRLGLTGASQSCESGGVVMLKAIIYCRRS